MKISMERFSMPVHEWIRAGKPAGVPFILTVELSSAEDWSEAVERELAVLTEGFAENYVYTIETIEAPLISFGSCWIERWDDRALLVTYDPMRDVLVSSAKICMGEMKHRNYSGSRGGELWTN